MKKIVKIFVYVVLLLFFLLFYLYYLHVTSNIKKLEADVNSKWSEYFLSSTESVKSTKDFLDSPGINFSHQSQIYITIERNLKERNQNKNECSLNFVKLEYDLNKNLKSLLDSTKLNIEKYESFKKALISSNDKLNNLIEEYNKSVLQYNMYFSTFPNFLIAKKNGCKRKKHFDIKYGIDNEDPITKNKEQPDWAIGVDTTLKEH